MKDHTWFVFWKEKRIEQASRILDILSIITVAGLVYSLQVNITNGNKNIYYLITLIFSAISAVIYVILIVQLIRCYVKRWNVFCAHEKHSYKNPDMYSESHNLNLKDLEDRTWYFIRQITIGNIIAGIFLIIGKVLMLWLKY